MRCINYFVTLQRRVRIMDEENYSFNFKFNKSLKMVLTLPEEITNGWMVRSNLFMYQVNYM